MKDDEQALFRIGIANSCGVTPCELKYLQYAADGYSIEDTASECGVGHYVVTMARSRAFDKLGADNIAHAIALGFRRGFLA